MRIFFIALLLTGCATAPRVDRASSSRLELEAVLALKFWTPTLSERKRAEQIARDYATRTLNLSKAHVAKMKTDLRGSHEGNARELWIQFYDPAVFQPSLGGRFDGMRGGFPSYFTITVNIEDWTVSHHYAQTK